MDYVGSDGALIMQVCDVHPESVETYRKHVPQLCKILRSLLMSGSSLSGEHDVGGITDPFLQAKVRSDVAAVAEDSSPRALPSSCNTIQGSFHFPQTLGHKIVGSCSRFAGAAVTEGAGSWQRRGQ